MRRVVRLNDFCALLFLLFFVLLYFENWTPIIFSKTLITSKVQMVFIVSTFLLGINRIHSTIIKYSYLLIPLLLFSFYFLLVSFFAAIEWKEQEIINITFLSNVLTMICLIIVIDQQPRVILAMALVNVVMIDIIYICAQMGIGLLESTEYEPGISRLRIFGLNPNGLSVYAVLSGISCFYALRQSTTFWQKLFFFASMVAVVLIIIWCGSQGGVILLFAALAILFWKRIAENKSLFFVPLLIITAIAFYFLFDFILSSRIFEIRLNADDLSDGRIDLLSRGVDVFLQSPILGNGIAGYNHYMQLFFKEVRPTHNGYLDILAYSGIVGAFVFLFYLIRQILVIIKKRDSFFYPVVLSLFAVFALNFAKDGGVLFEKFTWVYFAVLITISYQMDKIKPIVYDK